MIYINYSIFTKHYCFALIYFIRYFQIVELKLDFSKNKNYIQVTYVQPYFDENDLENRVSFFERNNNLRRFYFETSYYMQQLSGNDEEAKQQLNGNNKEHPRSNQDDVLRRLCKRKNILESKNKVYSFL